MRHFPTPRGLVIVVTVAVLGWGVSACAGEAPGANGGSDSATETTSRLDTRPFVECMRSHGLPDFPEVTVSSDGLVKFDIGGERVDVGSKLYGQALQACQSLLPDGTRMPDAPEAPPA